MTTTTKERKNWQVVACHDITGEFQVVRDRITEAQAVRFAERINEGRVPEWDGASAQERPRRKRQPRRNYYW